jgi:hypothetical protein
MNRSFLARAICRIRVKLNVFVGLLLLVRAAWARGRRRRRPVISFFASV